MFAAAFRHATRSNGHRLIFRRRAVQGDLNGYDGTEISSQDEFTQPLA